MYSKQILEDVSPCVFCGKQPYAYHYSEGMWYIICPNPNCKIHIKFGMYNFLGSTKQLAIDQWNYINRPINRTSAKGRKKDEDGDI